MSELAEEIETKDDTYWYLVLYILKIYNDYDTEKLWEKFSAEIKTKNRFFPESELIKKVTDIAGKVTYVMKAGETLYRARVYSQKDLLNNDIISMMMKTLQDELPDLNLEKQDVLRESAANIIMMNLCGAEEKRNRVMETIQNLTEMKKSFYGYDKPNSDAPSGEKAKAGRVNPEGISYLYTAKDIKTAILEMRPQMGQDFSIATIEITKEAKLFDFTYSPEQAEDGDFIILNEFQKISKEFSKPNFGNPVDYVPTQYLCECIKRLGFDGIRYKSAVSETGINVVLFDVNEETRVYDVTGSKVYEVNRLDIDISRQIPLADTLIED